MDNHDMLTRLITQATGDGQDLVTIRAMVEEASDAGAARALKRIGLSDDDAQADLAELRELLSAWRDAKASAWKSALKWGVQWVMRGCLLLVLIALAVEYNQLDMLR